MAKFELKEYHRNVSKEELIEDLKRVATLLKKNSVTINEYNKHGKFSYSSLWRRFGTWLKALEKAGLEKTRNLGITNEEYFRNLEEAWIKLGRQPYYNDMHKPLSKYVAGAYEYRFGTWRKALRKFIEYVNKEELPMVNKEIHIVDKLCRPQEFPNKPKTKRNISWRLRFIIMNRDNFKCKYCGRSPATDPKIILHVDHIIPWPKGETVPENLQTLCSVCNIGKSNLEI